MAVIFEDALKKNIASKNTAPVYILYGDDGYLKKMYCDKILKLITDKDDIFNYSCFGYDCDLQEVYDAAMQFPIMADKKFIELCDYDFDNASKTDFDRLCTLLSEVPNTATLVLRFDTLNFEPKKNTKFTKLQKACENNGGLVVMLNHRRPGELVKMLTDGAKKRGVAMESDAAQYLIETSGNDINILSNELNKLCAFSRGSKITKETVENVSVKTVEASVFNLSKFILDCNCEKSLSCLDDLFYMKIEPMTVLYTISGVFVDMFRLLSAEDSGLKSSAVLETYNYKSKEFLLDKAKQHLRKFNPKTLNLCLDELMKADAGLKSFASDARTVLEQMIIRLIYIISKDEAVD